MKLFQKLLLAPAALGLLAPVAATAAEINIDDVAGYAKKAPNQIRAAKASQFSDVVPGDWAYTALQNLSESYGCVDNAYTQNLKSGQALTRYEAAALVNSCLQGGVADAGNSDVLRLTNEFGTEMAILKGRVDGLEYKVEELSAGQFSPTTKLNSSVVFNLGYAKDDVANTGNAHDWKVNMTYTATADVTTSFSGSDKLAVKLETGNGTGTDPFHSSPAMLAVSNTNANALQVQEVWYTNTFGASDSFRYWVGPRVMSEMMLASSPSIYPSILEGFENGGNASTYGMANANGAIPGFGIAWTQQKDDPSAARFEVSSNYVAVNGASATNGLLGDEQSKWLSKVGYGSDRWQVSLAMAKNMCDDTTTEANVAESCAAFGSNYATTAAGTAANITGNQTSYALRAYWKPETTGVIPAVQLGYDWSSIEDNGVNATTAAAGSIEATQAWMAGLVWQDAFVDGNKAGIAFGVPEHATDYLDVNFPNNDPANKAFQWEAFYDYKVNDGITITPSIFSYKNRNAGTTLANDGFGGLIQTTFKF